jgi:peptide-N4-(N-acetyl-beta-glucosaminyl)asparagine amidase
MNLRKQIRREIEDAHILENFPGFRTGDSSLPPDFKQLVLLAKPEEMNSVAPSVNSSGQTILTSPLDISSKIGRASSMTTVIGNRKRIFFDPSKTGIGMPIYIQDTSSADKPFRKATAGGILKLKNSYFLMTVGHAFTDAVQDSDSLIEGDFEFDINSESSDEEEEIKMARSTSRGSLTPECVESPNSNATSMSISSLSDNSSFQHDLVRDCQYTTPSYDREWRLDSLDAKIIGSANNQDIPNHVTAIQGSLQISSIDGPRPELDYALVSINQSEFDKFGPLFAQFEVNQVMGRLNHIALGKPEENIQVLVATGSGGLTPGELSGTPTYIHVPHAVGIQEVWTVRLSGELEYGDCGSWVIHEVSGDLFGYIIAGSPGSKAGVAYIIPAYQVISELEMRFGEYFEIPLECHESKPRLDIIQHPQDNDKTLDLPGFRYTKPTAHPSTTFSDKDLGFTPRSATMSNPSVQGSWWSIDEDADHVSAITSYNGSDIRDTSITDFSGALEVLPEHRLPLFNIEKDGDPRIHWELYYDFIVTKTEIFFQLQPGYLPTNKFPARKVSLVDKR